MKDVNGIEIQEGDTVAYTHGTTTQLFTGVVERFTPKNLFLEGGNKKDPSRVMVITQQENYNKETYPELFI